MSPTSLLVVEDESIVAMDIKHRAEGLGYRVVGMAASGEEAIKLAREEKPDLVLMDIVLKGEMDGIEAAEVIRAEMNIPVVYLIAYSDEKTLSRAKLTGPFGYIIKPFEDRELHSAIEVALYKHRMDSKLRESEERYRALLEASPDPIILLDSDSRILFANRTVEELTGLDRKRLRGKKLSILERKGLLSREVLEKIADLMDHEHETFEIEFVDVKGRKHHFEIHSTTIETTTEKNLLQIIGHDITGRVEAEKRREELIRERSKAQLYGFVVSAVPVFASSIPPQLRNAIIKNFADRFEKNLKPNFQRMMEKLEVVEDIRSGRAPERVFNAYIKWLSGFLGNLGIETTLRREKSRYVLEFKTFPWINEARQNPIFSLIFRAMLMRSFTWTGIKGSVIQTSTLRSRDENLTFEFHMV
ncbi:methanogen output domain 1-containing protein [Methanothermobacter sp. K4]|uniref:methanogen output domain 1-containing protein n=1 Tax=Methanothermobacter sp. K4 TaxID=2913262 RepID=UPI001EDA295A|nr:methanogen output domain 1-containing protein [Methanothermobacter sp. K4]MCG2828444.1 methanogen output domain 1-containing protein [Methanothermobacter sp. K4]